MFLMNRARVNLKNPGLAYAMTLGVKVPDYLVERRFWADQHYEGGHLFMIQDRKAYPAMIEFLAASPRGDRR